MQKYPSGKAPSAKYEHLKEIEYRDQVRTLSDWARDLGLEYFALVKRFNDGDRGEVLFRPRYARK